MTDVRRPRDRVLTADIRRWAKDDGRWPGLSDRGRLPPGVVEAFEDANGGSVDAVDDVSVPDESDLDDDDLAYLQGQADGREVQPGEWVWADDGQPAVIQGPADYIPPPADLDEARERAGRDPEPAHLTRGRGRSRRGSESRKNDDTAKPVKVTRAVQADIEGKLAFWLAIPAEPWLRVDPYCGQAYADNIDQIALKMAPLVCQSPDLVRWFSKSSTFIMWTELGIAVRPVVEAIIAHHITKRIMLDAEGNVIVDQQGKPVPARTGGMDFSAYSARQPNPAAA